MSILSNFVSYVKQTWANKPSTSTPLSAERLGHIEDGIKANSDAIEKIAAAVISTIVNDPDKIASMAALYAVNEKVTKLNSDLTKYLPLAGGTLTGQILNLYNQKARFLVNSSQLQIEHYTTAGDTSNRVALLLSDTKTLEKAVIFSKIVDGTEKAYNIYGEHNKPTGSYIGNGSSESRTVEIGGVGAVLLVVGSNGYLSFVTASGAFGITGTSTSMTVLKKSECALSNGVLTIASTSNFLNASGETYYYRLL